MAPARTGSDKAGPIAERRRGPRRPGGLWRSAGARFAAINAVLLLSIAAAVGVFLWWQTAGLLDRQVEIAIRADAQGLTERWEQGGLPPLVLTIEDRLAQNVDDDAIYLVVDAQDRRITGNLSTWPKGVEVAGAWYELAVQRAGVRSLARVQRFDLLGGYRLLVGRDVRARAQLRVLLTNALFGALFVLLALGAVGGLLVRGLFARAIASVSVTATAISAGDLTKRVKLSGRGDEFDQLAETINVMLDRIGRLMDGVKQVSNAIAHDLRTPITRARSRLEDAALHATSREELQVAVERATAELDGIVAVFQALLRISEIEAGSRRSAFAPVDLGVLLADLAELYGAVAEERDARLDYDAPAHLPAEGDRAMIQQAVANLLDNALKFSPQGGTVWLSGSIDADIITITVADEGPGMAPEDLARATERFFRAETARSTPGSGLGLALVQAVAALHGGTLNLTSGNETTGRPGLRASIILPTTPTKPT